MRWRNSAFDLTRSPRLSLDHVALDVYASFPSAQCPRRNVIYAAAGVRAAAGTSRYPMEFARLRRSAGRRTGGCRRSRRPTAVTRTAFETPARGHRSEAIWRAWVSADRDEWKRPLSAMNWASESTWSRISAPKPRGSRATGLVSFEPCRPTLWQDQVLIT